MPETPSNIRSLVFTAVWIVLSTLIAAAGIEGVLRLYTAVAGDPMVHVAVVPKGTLVPSSVPGLRHALHPGVMGAGVRVNEFGFRAEPFSREKQAGEPRVFLIGDSIAYGFGLAQEDTIAYALQRRFDARFASVRTRFVNAAVPGYNAVQDLAVSERVLAPFEPDGRIVFLNWGDLEPYDTLVMNGDIERFLFAHSLAFRAVRTLPYSLPFTAARRAAKRHGREDNEAAIREMADRAAREPGRWLFIVHPTFVEQPPPYVTDGERWIENELADRGVPFLKTREPLVAHFGTLVGLGAVPGDIGHPNPEAADVIAEALLARLIEIGMVGSAPAGDSGQN
jgi:lysophospholipase L1-like esterase